MAEKQSEKKKSPWKTILNIVFSLVILLVLWKYGGINFPEIWQNIKNTDPLWYGLALTAYLIQIFTNTYRWHKLTVMIDYKISYWKALKLYFEGTFSNCFLPTNFAGDALRAYKLGSQDKNWIKAASTVLVERMLGFVMMFTLIPIGLFFLQHSEFKSKVPIELEYSLLAAFAAMVIAIGTYKLWSRINIAPIQKINYAVGIYTSCHKSISKVLLWTFLTHLFLLAGNICAAQALGISLSDIPFWHWFLLIPTAALAGFVVPSVKGLGAKEASYVYVLGIIGIDTNTALSIAVLCFSSFLISSVPGISVIFNRK